MESNKDDNNKDDSKKNRHQEWNQNRHV
jgi:hypothetical protein